LEPFPVNKKKQTLKIEITKKEQKLKEEQSFKYNPENISNPMDLSIRDQFTKILNFIDFNN